MIWFIYKLGQKSLQNLVHFLGDLKTPKFTTEINWPLQLRKEEIELMKNSKIWKVNIQARRNGWDKDKILDTFPEDVCPNIWFLEEKGKNVSI